MTNILPTAELNSMSEAQIERHKKIMESGHGFVVDGGYDPEEFQRFCFEQHGIGISLFDAEATIQFYAQTLIGESHE